MEELQNKIDNKLAFYDHTADKTGKNKYDFEYKLKKINDDQLPKFLLDNKENYINWFD